MRERARGLKGRGSDRDGELHERTLGFPFPFSLSLSTDGPGYILGSRHDERDDTRGLPNGPERRATAETRAAATQDGQRILLEHTVIARRAHSPQDTVRRTKGTLFSCDRSYFLGIARTGPCACSVHGE